MKATLLPASLTFNPRRVPGLVVLACSLCCLAPARGQQAGAFQAYPLRHAQAREVEAQLSKLLTNFPMAPEVIADAEGNRLLVRGNADAQQLVRQFLETLDRPAQRPAEPPALKAYAYSGDLAGMAAQLQQAYAGRSEVRIATDARTGQLLVMAPPEVQDEIARRLGSGGRQAPSAASALPGVSLPSSRPAEVAALAAARSRTVALRNSTWEQIERALAQLTAGRLMAGQTGGEVASYKLAVPEEGDLQLLVNHRANQIEVRGPGVLADRLARLIQVLDTPQSNNRRTRLLPVATASRPSVQRATQVLQSGQLGAELPANSTALQAARQSGAGIPLVAQLFQPPQQQLAQQQQQQPQQQPVQQQPPAPAPNGRQQPPVAGPAEPGAEEPLTSGLVGPVQIEFLEGLDIMIISGNQRDVERVSQIIADIERLSVETEPTILVHPLDHVGSEALATLVTPIYDQVLSPRQGRVSITPLVKPNALLLIGRDESVKSVVELVERLDQPVGPASQFAVFPLRHAAATDAQATITQFFTERTGLGPRPVVTAEFRTNSLIVHASPRDLAEVAELIKRIDTGSSGAVEELRVFPLENSLAEELAPVLQDAITGQGARPAGLPAGLPGAQAAPATGTGKSAMLRFTTIDPQGDRELSSGLLTDVKITADPRANALIVSGPADSMDLIGALIRQLDQIPAAESQIKVFTVVNGDAQLMVQMLQSLFGQQQQPGGGGVFGAPGQQAVSFLGENPLVSLRFSVDQRTNSIIASGSAPDLNIVEAILLRLDESDVRQRQSVVYRLKNAPAIAVAQTINDFLRSERDVQSLAPAQISPFQQIEREVVVVPEQVSNSLIVSATPRYFEEIRKIVEELDARPPMVMIQVLIAEVTLNNTDEFGVELGLQDSVLFDRSLLGDLVTTSVTSQQAVPGGGTITTTDQIVQAATLTPGFNFNNQPLGNSGSTRSLATAGDTAGQALTNFSVGRVNGDLGFGGLVLSASSESISILVRALKECRRLDVLSRPQVMTLDNQPAFIQVGARVPRVQGVTQGQVGVAPILNVIDTNVGLILGVTPRISPDGLVVMEIDAERSALGPESEGVPITTTQTGEVVRSPLINTTTAQTTVSAVDGQTVVLGGLITKTKSSTRRRVPLLSSIPVLGNLFRYDLEIQQRTELLIIMTPHIVRNEADADRVKQMEAARMSWCLADVRKIHGDPGIVSRDGDWADDQTMVIYPDQNPTAMEVAPGAGTELLPPYAAPGSILTPSPTQAPGETLPGPVSVPQRGPAGVQPEPRIIPSQPPGQPTRAPTEAPPRQAPPPPTPSALPQFEGPQLEPAPDDAAWQRRMRAAPPAVAQQVPAAQYQQHSGAPPAMLPMSVPAMARPVAAVSANPPTAVGTGVQAAYQQPAYATPVTIGR